MIYTIGTFALIFAVLVFVTDYVTQIIEWVVAQINDF